MPAQAFHFSPPVSSLQPKASPRRGVILLVLLGMLALFGATAFAFVVIASHGAQTAKALQKVDRVAFSPRNDLEEAMRQVLRGPNSEDYHSVLRHHSLLEDLYGNSTVGGWILSERVLQSDPSATPSWTNPKGYQSADMEFMPYKDFYPTNQSLQHAQSLHSGQVIEFIAGYTVPGPYVRPGPDFPGAETGGYAGGHNASSTKTYPDGFGDDGEDFPRHVGKVLTIRVPGAYENLSTRIVGHRRQNVYDGSGDLQVVYHYYQILPFEGISSTGTATDFRNLVHSGADFIINGAPFSGAGAGYDTSTRTNDAAYSTGFPYALLPNPTDPDYHTATNSVMSANEDYDAPDYQNMLLAMEHYDGYSMNLTRSPSLHRPALANYWLQRLALALQDGTYASMTDVEAWRALIRPRNFAPTLADAIIQIKRRCTLRPLWEDHPTFDGSNSNWTNGSSLYYDVTSLNAITDVNRLQSMAERCWGAADLAPNQTYPWFVDLVDNTTGSPPSDGIPDREVVPWDVDNDGDGIPDSIWVDLGLPVRSFADGRKYKPLVAIHCVDLDGRINLNTAGSVEQLYDARYHDNALAPADYIADGTIYANNLTGTVPTATPHLLRGQGAGTAEISPLPVLYESSYGTALYENLLLGDTTMSLNGRYGELRRLATAPAGELRWPAPGFTPAAYAYYGTGMPTPETLFQNRLPGYPTNYFDAVAGGTALAYGSPLDLKGTLVLGLDLFGQPVYSAMGASYYDSSNAALNLSWGWNTNTWLNAGFDTPYELKLGANVSQGGESRSDIDNPFNVAELEPLLRKFDADSLRLPDRLRRLLDAQPDARYRLWTTTESWDLPVPNLAMPDELLDEYLADQNHLPIHPVDLVWAKLLELHANHQSELLTGDWFYPHPDDVDFDNLLSADIHAGLRVDLNRSLGDGTDNNSNGVVDEPNEPGDSDTNNREAYARTLYVLMMALVDPDWYPYWEYQLLGSTPASAGPHDRRSARARALAQWAVNIVDYRDPDSIMTRFEYDPYPFAYNDGGATTRTTVPEATLLNTWNPTGTEVVWGCERPELLITETMATHDRRQVYRPGSPPTYANEFRAEGALFVELFNPNSPAEPAPGTLAMDRSTGTNVGGVRLNQTTPTGNDPVWRLAIYNVLKDGDNMIPDGAGYYDPTPDGLGQTDMERLVYFIHNAVPATGYLPEGPNDPTQPIADVAFYPSAALAFAPVLPHRYAVIGPGDTANTAYGPGANAGTTLFGELPSSNVSDVRRIEIVPHINANQAQQVRIFADGQNDQVEYLRSSGIIQPPVGILIDRPQRLSISEPPAGYDADTNGSYDWANGYGGGAGFDPAEDLARTDELSTGTDANGDTVIDTWKGPISEPGTTSALRYVHLQRLANPLLPFNISTNRYITIDAAPVDLTAFDSASGSNHAFAQPSAANGTAREYPQGGLPLTDAIFSRQRGEEQLNLHASTSQLWRPLIVGDPNDEAASLPTSRDANNLPIPLDAAADPHTNFSGPFNQSFGFLNEFYYYNGAGDRRLDPTTWSLGNAYRGAPGRLWDNGGSDEFESHPFPWLTWLNRPFANPMELLQVPAVSASRLLYVYQHDNMGGTNQTYLAGHERFGHLLPFFSTLQGDPADVTDDAVNNVGKFYPYNYDTDHAFDDFVPNTAIPTEEDVPPPHLYRLFEYVHVPSRFVDSAMDTSAGLISNYREPGKLNLNTIAEQEVLTGLFYGHRPAMPQVWEEFLATRRGFHANDEFGFEIASGVPPLPTRIANPFRSFAGVNYVSAIPGLDGANPYLQESVVREGINATLLHAQVNNWGSYSATDYVEDILTRAPLFTQTNASTQPYDNTAENPFFSYQSLQRLSNLATTRSNVYAVWITLGYFEVERDNGFNPGSALHQQLYPDGYVLGQELGIDTGEVKRHRAFYIIDRSIPAGFIPGQDLNTENTVLLRRFIE